MKTVKIRVWDGESMIYDFGTVRDVYYSIVLATNENDEIIAYWEGTASANTMVVMLFTGLHDRTGTEVYDGDLLGVTGVDSDDTVLYRVTYADGYRLCAVCVDNPHAPSLSPEQFGGTSVAGNVFQRS
jgi:hypothetical protein